MNPLTLAYRAARSVVPSEYRQRVAEVIAYVFRGVSDETYLKRMYKFRMGRELDLQNPKSFTEKIQWLKLYNRRPEYTSLADKYEAKKIIASIVGSQYVPETLGVYDSFDAIDFDSLPDSFVLKCTHDSGSVVVVPDKRTFDKKAARKILTRGLKRNFSRLFREWIYSGIKPRIIAEEYISGISDEYKIFCFNGKPGLILLCKGKAHVEGRTNDFYTLDFEHIPVSVAYPNSPVQQERPEQLDEILDLARKLSAGIPQVRVDTFLAGGRVYVGEMTFYHEAGYTRFKPEEYDYKFGEMITLPEKRS